MGLAKDADQLREVEGRQEVAVHHTAQELDLLELALSQATSANIDLDRYQRW